MHIHRTLFHISITAPDAIEQLPAREHSLWESHEKMQQAILSRTQGDLALARTHTMARVIEIQTSGFHHLSRTGRRRAPQNRLDARQQLTGREGFGDVV